MTTPRSRWIAAVCASAALAAVAPSPAGAQLLGGGLGGTLGGIARPLGEQPVDRREAGHVLPIKPSTPIEAASGALSSTALEALTAARRIAGEQLIRNHPDQVEADGRGNPVVRGEALALAPTAAALEAARRAGFRIAARNTEAALGLEIVTLLGPDGMSAREAVQRLRALDPQGQYDFDHIYLESGETGAAARGTTPVGAARGVRVGLVDGSVASAHPALQGVRITQAAFAPGGAKITGHATAVASLLAGSDGVFRGAAPGAALFVADVYGPTPAGGSAQAIVRGLGWLAQSRVGVINISLVGPPNLILGAAVRSLVDRGVLLVAAVGNDGPAAPPLYPAAYPGVVAVTGVDGRRRVLPEAGRGAYVSFAAPGAEMAAAAPAGGFAVVRGTSFAAPIVAGELARDLPEPDPVRARRALARLARAAVDLGAPGRDPIYGLGLVGFELKTTPAEVAARGPALNGP